MQTSYIVRIKLIKDDEFKFVNCKNEQELADFLMHLDKEKYDIDSIAVNDIVFEEDKKAFFKKNKELETGRE